MRVAIVYDWLDKWGGVERLLQVIYEMFPKAIFFTSYYDFKGAGWAKDLEIKTSFIQKLPDFIKKNRILSLPLYPFAFESFNMTGFDLVISVSSSFAKSVITKPGTVHVLYLLTPTRFLWTEQKSYFENNKLRFVSSPIVSVLKKWDLVAAQRPDHIISISKTVQERCKKYYLRDSEIIYPPFDVDYWAKIKSKISIKDRSPPYYLVVSRLEPYKRVDLIVQSFNRLNELKLIVAGKGTQENYLKRIAGKNIKFLQDLSDIELGLLYQDAKALIMPQVEDFGYVSLEAQFFGCPVIAYKKGGTTETIIEGKTGLFFENQTVTSLVNTLAQFEDISYNMKTGVEKFGLVNVRRFDKRIFVKKSLQYLYPKLENK